MTKKITFVSLIAVSSMIGFGLQNAPVSYGADAGATLKGSVVFKGTPPAPVKIKTTADPACQMLHPSGIAGEDYVIGKTGGLKNVFVYVKEGLEGKTFPPEIKPATITQQGCQYTPHVIGVQAGQPLEIVNNDSTLHNVNAQPKNNSGFNFAQPVQGMKNTKKFDKPEIMIPFICNVHPWMKSFVGVVGHPFFAVSNDAGQFEIKDLPPGTYVLEAWHEKLGTAQQKITVKAGETKAISFSFAKS
jgi:plastocyanin